MKNKRQYRDSAMFTMIGYIGIILVVLAMLVGIGEYTGFNEKVQKGLQDDPRPLTPLVNYTHPNTWSVEDSTRIIDSLRCNDSIFDALLNTNESLDTIEQILDRIILKLDSLEQTDEYDGNEYHIRTYEDSEEDLEHWYTVVDTNSNGTPDNIERWDTTLQKWVLKDEFDWDQGPCGGDYEAINNDTLIKE